MKTGSLLPSIVVAVFLALPLPQAWGQVQPLSAASLRQERVRAVLRATVKLITVRDRGDTVTGSGFIVTPEGMIVTAAHVVAGARSIAVRTAAGDLYAVQGLLDVDQRRDFAIARIAGFDLPMVTLGNSDSLEVGQRLLAFGAPLGLESTVADGLLSSVRVVEGIRVLQVSIPVSPGSSGGPVVTEEGSVVGLIILGSVVGYAQNLNFALPINYVRGQIALASQRGPTPLRDVPWFMRPPGNLPSPETSTPPPRVNAALSLNWLSLAGVQAYVEGRRAFVEGEGEWVRQGVSVFAVTHDPSGVPMLERRDTWHGYAMPTPGGVPSPERHFVTEAARVAIATDTIGRFEYYSSIRPDSPTDTRVKPLELNERFDGQRLVLGSGKDSAAAYAPRGAIPRTLVDAAVAALPDSLPATVHLAVLEEPPSSRVDTLRFDFGQLAVQTIPVPRSGHRCDARVETVRRSVEVVLGTVTHGVNVDSVVVLRHQPHLRVDASGIRCVHIPSGPTEH